jgi:hypothetical protein
MKAKAEKHGVDCVVDRKRPWRLPRVRYRFNPSYRLSRTQWRTLLEKAEGGDADAGATVAAYYKHGCKDRYGKVLVRRSEGNSAHWLRRSAELGSAIAQVGLGVMLSAPDADAANRLEARAWLVRAYRQADATAAYDLAVMHREDGNYRGAVLWFRNSVALDDESAHLQLGIHYYWGIGVRKNHNEAVRAFRKTVQARFIAEVERDDAFFYLAIAHLEGNGVRQSLRTATKLLKRANIDNDHPAARLLLPSIARE